MVGVGGLGIEGLEDVGMLPEHLLLLFLNNLFLHLFSLGDGSLLVELHLALSLEQS